MSEKKTGLASISEGRSDIHRSGIYIITNNINGMYYIGSAIDLSKRWKGHLTCLRGNRHINAYLQSAWNLYGEENFKCQVLEYVENKEWLVIQEHRWISRLNAYGFGYNLCPIAGNSFGYRHTEEAKLKMIAKRTGRKASAETKARMSESQKRIGNKPVRPKHFVYTDEHRKKIGLKHKNKSVSEETKEKQSKAARGNKNCLGRKVSEETKKKIAEANKKRHHIELSSPTFIISE